jgi:hypothetical protein
VDNIHHCRAAIDGETVGLGWARGPGVDLQLRIDFIVIWFVSEGFARVLSAQALNLAEKTPQWAGGRNEVELGLSLPAAEQRRKHHSAQH